MGKIATPARQAGLATAGNKTDPNTPLHVAELEERVRSLEREIADLRELFASWAST
jgi:hypothetical protein